MLKPSQVRNKSMAGKPDETAPAKPCPKRKPKPIKKPRRKGKTISE